MNLSKYLIIASLLIVCSAQTKQNTFISEPMNSRFKSKIIGTVKLEEIKYISCKDSIDLLCVLTDSSKTGQIITESILPDYPIIAMRAGVEGRIKLFAYVNSIGKTDSVKVVDSDAELFVQPTIDAVSRYTLPTSFSNCVQNDICFYLTIRFTKSIESIK